MIFPTKKGESNVSATISGRNPNLFPSLSFSPCRSSVFPFIPPRAKTGAGRELPRSFSVRGEEGGEETNFLGLSFPLFGLAPPPLRHSNWRGRWKRGGRRQLFATARFPTRIPIYGTHVKSERAKKGERKLIRHISQ